MILFIDDDNFGMTSYRMTLEDAGLLVQMVETPDQALAFLESKSADVDLIVLDILMPSGEVLRREHTNGGLTTGYRLLEKITEIFPKIPIILFSITGETGVEGEDFNRDVKFLSKQNTLPRELLASIKECLGLE